jgi:hypothetical protein
MEVRLQQQKPPDNSAEQQTSNDLVKLIRKLRWMGREDEAKQAQLELARCRSRPVETVIAGPADTD